MMLLVLLLPVLPFISPFSYGLHQRIPLYENPSPVMGYSELIGFFCCFFIISLILNKCQNSFCKILCIYYPKLISSQMIDRGLNPCSVTSSLTGQPMRCIPCRYYTRLPAGKRFKNRETKGFN